MRGGGVWIAISENSETARFLCFLHFCAFLRFSLSLSVSEAFFLSFFLCLKLPTMGNEFLLLFHGSPQVRIFILFLPFLPALFSCILVTSSKIAPFRSVDSCPKLLLWCNIYHLGEFSYRVFSHKVNGKDLTQ